MECYNYKPIIFAVVGMLPPDLVDDFKQHLQNYPDFRIVKIKTGDNKIFLVEQGGRQ